MSEPAITANRLTRQIEKFARMQYALAGILLVAAMLFYLAAYRPQQQQISGLDRQAAAKHLELLSARQQTDRLPRVTLELDSLKRRLAGFKKLPDDPQYGQFIRDINQASESAKLTKLVVQPGAAHRAELFSEQPISLSFQGTFPQAWSFIRALEDMERLTRLRDLTITKLDSDKGTVDVKLTVNIYYAATVASAAGGVMSGILATINAAIGRDPKRSAVLAALVVFMAVLWGRMLFSGPRLSAAASTAAAPLATVSLPEPTHAPHSSVAASLSEWAQQRANQAPRNLFAVPFELYPADPAHPAQSAKKGAEQTKSPTQQADQMREHQKLVDDLREQAAKLTLESTMPGDHPRAWIDGLLVGIGEPIGQSGFTVAKVETRRVFIEQDGVQIILSMK